jgi:hypothetical protein
MIKVISIIVILYIIIQNFLENNSLQINDIENINLKQSVDKLPYNNLNKLKQNYNFEKVPSESTQENNINFDTPNPWTRIIVHTQDEYPYHFHIKLKIPSLNDYDNWKEIIPNLNFNAQTGELIIPSKDEPSALAIANLICINFLGQITLKNILDKNLIQISIIKSKNYELVQNKLREQINENINGKNYIKSNTQFHQDLGISSNINSKKNSKKIDFLTDSQPNNDSAMDNLFNRTFEKFSGNNNENDNIEAYDGHDFSYL